MKPCKRGHISPRNSETKCIQCVNERLRAKYWADPVKSRAERCAWRAANLEHSRKYERIRNRARNGLPEPMRPMPERCENPGCVTPRPYKRRMVLDHCHETGAFRGWLCSSCNVSLGQLGDSEKSILGILEYLRRARTKLRSVG